MGVLERANYVVRADLNDLLRRGRDPQLVLEGYLEDLEAVLEEAESIRHSEQAEREGYAANLRDVKAVIHDMEKKARICLERGDEELARAALERKLDMQQEAVELGREIEQRDRTIQVLSDSIAGLKARIEEVRRRRREVRFRKQLLEARATLQQAISRVRQEENEPLLGEAAENLAELEGRLEAEETMRSEGLESRLHSLEASARQERRHKLVEQEIQRLRRQLGTTKERKG